MMLKSQIILTFLFVTLTLNSSSATFNAFFDVASNFFSSIFYQVNSLNSSLRLFNDKNGTQFNLFTRDNPDLGIILHSRMNWTEIKRSSLSMNKPTKIIIHGFIENEERGVWRKELKDQFIRYQDCNVITVDWTWGNGLPYSKAVANSKFVGTQIAKLIHKLMVS